VGCQPARAELGDANLQGAARYMPSSTRTQYCPTAHTGRQIPTLHVSLTPMILTSGAQMTHAQPPTGARTAIEPAQRTAGRADGPTLV
jgi:hypothetical protein